MDEPDAVIQILRPLEYLVRNEKGRFFKTGLLFFGWLKGGRGKGFFLETMAIKVENNLGTAGSLQAI